MKHWNALFIISFLFLLGCDDDSKGKFNGIGKVVDFETGEPVDSALVELHIKRDPYYGEDAPAQQRYTNSKGEFNFNNGDENLGHTSVKIWKAPYYALSERTLGPDNTRYFLYPAAVLHFKPKVTSPPRVTAGVAARLYYNNRVFKFWNVTPFDYHSSHFVPLKGETEYLLELTLIREAQVLEVDTIPININFRDTLTIEYLRDIQ